MISQNVTATIYGNIGSKLYSAYISGSGGNKRAYVVSRKKVAEALDGIVIAVAEFEGMEGERAIVSPYGEIFMSLSSEGSSAD